MRTMRTIVGRLGDPQTLGAWGGSGDGTYLEIVAALLQRRRLTSVGPDPRRAGIARAPTPS